MLPSDLSPCLSTATVMLLFTLSLHKASAGPCPSECKCREDTLEGIGAIYSVRCTDKELINVPDLSPLSAVTRPIHLSLDNNEIKSVSNKDFPSGLNIVSLDLSQNKQLDIGLNSFMNLVASLKTLSLDAVDMTFDKTLNILSYLEKLEELSVSHNNRRGYVSGAVENVDVVLFDGPVTRSLKILKMSHCGMRSLSAVTLDKLIALRELDLSNNWFTKVPAAVKHLKELRQLSMFRGNIDTLEDYTFLGLSNLEVIDMNSNGLEEIERYAFRGLENSLKRLKLERCRLKKIPSQAIANLEKLEYLDLTQNSFTAAPSDSFVGKYCLKKLSISSVGMTFDKDTFIGQKDCVTDLTIKQMKLTTVPRKTLSVLKKLTRLSLEYNEISVLPKNSFKGIEATVISLANNPLMTIKPGAFSGLPPNLDINLRRTKISDIDFLIDYPEDAIKTVNLDYADLKCRCSMKSSLNATENVEIYGSCTKGTQIMPLSSSRLEGILDVACEEEKALNSAYRMKVGSDMTAFLVLLWVCVLLSVPRSSLPIVTNVYWK